MPSGAHAIICPCHGARQVIGLLQKHPNGRIELHCSEGCSPDVMLAPRAVLKPSTNGAPHSPPTALNGHTEAVSALAPAIPDKSDPREWKIAHWQGDLLNLARLLLDEVKSAEDLAAMLLHRSLSESAPRILQRPCV